MRTSGRWSMAFGMMLAFAGAATQAKDFNALLQGDYIVTGGSAACLFSNLGFEDAPGFQPKFGIGGGTFMNSFNITGVRTFNGDGTGHAVARNVSLSHPPGGGVGTTDIVSNFTYEVGPDLSITIYTVSLTSTQLVGPRRNHASTVSGFAPFVGKISEDLSTITIAHVYPQVETVHWDDPVLFPDQQRICYRDRVLIRAKRH